LALERVTILDAGDAVTTTQPALTVLALNSGSSSLKFGLYRVSASRTETLLSGVAESIGEATSKFHVRDSQGGTLIHDTASIPGQRDAIVRIGAFLDGSGMRAPAAVGHRIVHGGSKLRRHCMIDQRVMQQLDSAIAFAPLHTPAALSVVRFAQEHFPGLPQVACFDTTFHAGMPDVARVLPIPKELHLQGIERYGFHGLSCESIVHQLEPAVPDRLIIAHLGNGASVTAVRNGKSIDTSMGLTPSGGVIMGTRSGDLDPGVLVYLMRERKFDAAMLEDLIDHRSGLLGISGVESDMRRLHDVAPANPDARLAVEMFCYSVRKQIAAMMAALDGVDTIVFTGGIGENDGEVRASICAGLTWAGISLGAAQNRAASRVLVQVLPSQEDEQIARHTRTLSQR
jgi:acetate kinase